jgi:Bacterial SH3 domain
MGQLLRSVILIATGFTLPIALAGITYAIVRPESLARPMMGNSALSPNLANPAKVCQTLIADPSPPVNVRSSPVVTSDNTVNQLPNGTEISIADENEGWLKINQPLEGWVYKELTVTSCLLPHETATSPSSDSGAKLFAIATEQYQSGNINGAIALAKTVTSGSPAHTAARNASVQWQKDWQQAESNYYVAQKAVRDGRWQDVINQVKTFPDNRYWKEKLAPLVKQAVGEVGSTP